jgi:hypothetical protein
MSQAPASIIASHMKCVMAMNRVRYQPELSMLEFFEMGA